MDILFNDNSWPVTKNVIIGILNPEYDAILQLQFMASDTKHVGLSENVGYIPNEIAIFHRDNDHENHWV